MQNYCKFNESYKTLMVDLLIAKNKNQGCLAISCLVWIPRSPIKNIKKQYIRIG